MGIEETIMKSRLCDTNSGKEAQTSAYRRKNGIPAGAGSVIRRAIVGLSERFWVI